MRPTLRVQYVAHRDDIDESIRRAVGPCKGHDCDYDFQTKVRTLDFEFGRRQAAAAAENRVLHLNRVGALIHGLKTGIIEPS